MPIPTRRLSRPGFYIELVLPPALLAYFAWAWRVCTGPFLATYISDGLGYPRIAVVYRIVAAVLIATISTIFLRLYFLPSRFATPPPSPPPEISNLTTIFEVPPPASAYLVPHDDERLINHCHSGSCNGRWKPPRARHCSECGRCRLGFDHHCLFVRPLSPVLTQVANCISAPALPAFTALLLITPPAVLFLAGPLLRPVIYGARLAWRATATNPRVQAYWGWGWSWVVPAGPVARYAVGLLLAWADLPPPSDRSDAMWRVDIGILWAVGNLLALITAALAIWQVKQMFTGTLGNDMMRARAYAKAADDVRAARARGAEDGDALAAMRRFAPDKWFFVPLQHETYAGAVIPALGEPYDLGSRANFDLLVGRGRGWRWILPWNCLRSGMSTTEASVWPISDSVKARLKSDATELLEQSETL
ncbi:hypothetical protein CC85DRAFT_302479 [Cutaneotrichosporon oleaginosum]|uniref:Palmitoyltransferase n=1 Tax=Cutaneotrichosporon oleaginosum TaxID=879819 RepID=A0A0J1B3P5_9TREE|nr:uncharacterized protein CC85DRAFT_302479 [Cutaneotrichosporon oleaginosum]KLT42274.1 hypothetical protein CC85DRAFT_302479 [Cutaneotrichosporon oleaginosum]TXT11446.1 hypothetical protein COLE_01856 [Cutaneotrichosporon oleaginosum]